MIADMRIGKQIKHLVLCLRKKKNNFTAHNFCAYIFLKRSYKLYLILCV
jgi:hypothetical protein